MNFNFENSGYWWKDSESSIFQSVFSYVKFLEDNQPNGYTSDINHMKLYGNTGVFGMYPRNLNQNRLDRLKLNIVKSMCDTVTSKIGKNRVKPTFLTQGGDWSLQRKAKKLERFSTGQLYGSKYYQKAPGILLDSTVLGTGCLKVYRIGKEIKLERVLKSELRVDYQDGFYGDPRSLFQVKYIPREVLIDMFPDFESQIRGASNQDEENSFFSSKNQTKSDMVKVIEGWHLRSSKEATDGKHVIVCSNVTLVDEEYKRDYFPFAFLHWSRSMTGFWGTGLAEILMGIQIEINKILRENQDIFHLMDIPQVFMQAGSKVVTSHFDNQIGTIHTVSGEIPTPWKAGTVGVERFNYLNFLLQQAYEMAGVSQLSASAKKPEGLDSGKAIRTFHDIETERFAMVERAWEDLAMEVTRQQLDLASEIDEEEEGGYEVLVDASKSAEKIKWSEVNLKEDQYIMKVFPTNLLPDTPEGKLQTVQEMMQAGLYGPEEGRRLLDYPDTEAVNQYLNADQDEFNLIIEDFIDKGRYHVPEAFQKLEIGIPMLRMAYIRAKIDQVPEEKLELFRRWISEASALMAPPAPPMPEGQGMMPMDQSMNPMPPANPEPPPTSDLLSNVNNQPLQ